MNRFVRRAAIPLCVAVLLGATGAAHAADVPGWYSTTDLSFVLTEGNAKTSNLGINSNITRKWLRTEWDTTISVVRSDAAEPTRRAIGTTPGGAVLETGPRVTKAETYFANTDFKRRVTERFYWNVGGSGERDKFAGLNHLITGVVGIGYLFTSPLSSGSFSAGIGGTYTTMDEVIDDPETENQFAGVRLTADGEARFGETDQNAFTSNLVVDENLQDTDDLRFNWQNSLSMALTRSQRLALKVGVGLSYDNEPQLVEFPIFLQTPGGLLETDQALAGRAEKLDTSFTVSLVINFGPGGPVGRPDNP